MVSKLETKINSRWTSRWNVIGSRGDNYTVAVDKNGNWGCSCWPWRKSRLDCKHILSVKASDMGGRTKFPKPSEMPTEKETKTVCTEYEEFGIRKIRL